MIELFLFSFISIFNGLGREKIALICIALIILSTATCLILSLTISRYSILKRLWLAFLYVGIFIFQIWAEKVILANESYLLLSLSIIIMLLPIMIFIKEKNKKATTNQISLARYFDKCAKESLEKDNKDNDKEKDELEKSNEKKDFPPIKILTKQKDIKKQNDNCPEIDFSHVKSILDRLEFYSLTSQDKKQAKELEDCILLAEKEGLSIPLKEKINDGLGALLKIMSKHAI